MGGKSDYLRNGLLDFLLRGQAFTPPATTYIALFTSAPSAAGGGVEVNAGGYQRFAIASTLTGWRGTNGNTNVSTGTTGRISNNGAISFGTPSADWGTVTHWALMTAQNGGSFLYIGTLASPTTIHNGDPGLTFQPDTLAIYEV